MKFYLIVPLFLLLIGFTNAGEKRDKKTDEKNANVLVLDVSKGMRNTVDGIAKIDMLREAVPQFLENWPEEEKLAVLAYGRRGKNSCKRIRILNKVQRIDNKVLSEKLAKIKPVGRAPLISAIYKAERQLRNRKGNIILISSGKDNCSKKSVCEITKRMKKNHPDIFIHTIDLQGDNEALKCIAESTGGEYHPIQNITNLASSLFSLGRNKESIRDDEGYSERSGRLVLKSTETEGGNLIPASYIIYSDEGKHVASYTSQDTVEKTLPVGSYTITAIYNLLAKEIKLNVGTESINKHTFILGESGTLSLVSKYRGRSTSTLYTIYNKNGMELVSGTSVNVFTQALPVGSYRVEAKHDGDKKIIKVNIEKNQIEKVLVRF